MKKMQALLGQFHDAVLSGRTEEIATALKPHSGLTPGQQMAIYSDGYRIRLMQALRADYPALLSLLGDSAFDALALRHVESHPSTDYNLDRYSHAFADSLTIQDRFALELAQLEKAVAQVFMMEESAPLLAQGMENLTPEAFGELVLRPRPASRLLAFEYPVNDWLTRQRRGEILPVPSPEPSFVYVYRHNHEVQRLSLEEVAYYILREVMQGIPVGAALDTVIASYPHSMPVIAGHLQSWFAAWLGQGIFANGVAVS